MREFRMSIVNFAENVWEMRANFFFQRDVRYREQFSLPFITHGEISVLAERLHLRIRRRVEKVGIKETQP